MSRRWLTLAGAFWWTYRRRARSREACCGVEPTVWTRADRVRKGVLWGVTLLTLLVAAYPVLQKHITVSATSVSTSLPPASEGRSERITLEIQGMTCAACEGHIRSALASVPGVHSAEAHYAEGLAMVVTDGSLVDPTPLIRSVERAGYRVAGATRKS